MVVIFKLSPNDQQVPGKLLNISRKLPGMLSEYSTQLNLNKHSYKTVNIFVCVTLWLKGRMGRRAGGGLSDTEMSSAGDGYCRFGKCPWHLARNPTKMCPMTTPEQLRFTYNFRG